MRMSFFLARYHGINEKVDDKLDADFAHLTQGDLAR